MKKITFLMSIVFMPWAIGNGQFEEGVAEKDSSKKVHVDVGGAFAMQYQHLNHEADSALIPLGKGINLPTANLDIRAYLVPGIMINLTTYLSSRHHVEAWVKGGYLMIDEMPFIKWNALDKAMDYLTLKIGDMEINYGDAHFRRSDNGNVNKNPFVGNYIMDAFVTSPALEILFQNKGWLAMGAISSGNLKPALTGYNESTDTYTNYNLAEELAFYGKLGFDKQLLSFRFRTTVSAYYCGNNHAGALYYGDRAGSRYYLVMNKQEGSNSVDPAHNHTSGRWGPGFTDRDRSFMVNLYTRYLGFELFGTYENVDGTNLGGAEFDYNQYAIEGLYYFGKEDQFYGGVRYNYVKDDTGMSIDRFQASIGWFLTEHIKAKVEYVNQNYNEFITYGDNAAFNGIMVEAGISF
jgi:hypothetical protein